MKVHSLRGNIVYHFVVTVEMTDGTNRRKELFPVATSVDEAEMIMIRHVQDHYPSVYRKGYSIVLVAKATTTI